MKQSVTIANIFPNLPEYLKALSEAGVESASVELALTVEELLANPDFLTLASALGFKNVILTAFPKKGYLIRSRFTKIRTALEKLAPILEKEKVKLVIPVFGDSLLPSATGAFHLLRGLAPFSFGVQLDPGGTIGSGVEPWDYTVGMLGDYLELVLVRDSRFVQRENVWETEWAPMGTGLTNWDLMKKELTKIQFAGTLALAPMLGEDSAQMAIVSLGLQSHVE